MTDVSEWIDSFYKVIGLGGTPPKVEGTVKDATQQVAESMADWQLKNGSNEQCEAPTEPEAPSTSPHPDEEKKRTQSLNYLGTRINAITRRVHQMIDNSETVECRTTDPVVASLNQKQMNLGAHYSQLRSEWDSLSGFYQSQKLVSLESAVSALECEVRAHPNK